jgi:hypothetical protein
LIFKIRAVFHLILFIILLVNTPPTVMKKIRSKTMKPITLCKSLVIVQPICLIPKKPMIRVISRIIVPVILWIHMFIFQNTFIYLFDAS